MMLGDKGVNFLFSLLEQGSALVADFFAAARPLAACPHTVSSSQPALVKKNWTDGQRCVTLGGRGCVDDVTGNATPAIGQLLAFFGFLCSFCAEGDAKEPEATTNDQRPR